MRRSERGLRALRPGDQVRDYRDGRPEVRAAIRNAERFLVLAALVSVLLGGVAVAIAARRFVARRLDAVAVMKCLGARYRDVLRLNLLQLLLLVVAAAVVGCIGGLLAQFGLTALLADFIEARLPPPSAAAPCSAPLPRSRWPSAARYRRCSSSAACRRRACYAAISTRRRCAISRYMASRRSPSCRCSTCCSATSS